MFFFLVLTLTYCLSCWRKKTTTKSKSFQFIDGCRFCCCCCCCRYSWSLWFSFFNSLLLFFFSGFVLFCFLFWFVELHPKYCHLYAWLFSFSLDLSIFILIFHSKKLLNHQNRKSERRETKKNFRRRYILRADAERKWSQECLKNVWSMYTFSVDFGYFFMYFSNSVSFFWVRFTWYESNQFSTPDRNASLCPLLFWIYEYTFIFQFRFQN